MSAEPAMTDRLTDDDAALLLPAMAESKAATEALQAAITRQNAAQGTVNYLLNHLAPKYGLVAGDNIGPDGAISRKENSVG